MPSHMVRRFTELEAWLREHAESGRAFALRSGISKSKLNRLLNGEINQFDFALVRRVKKATGKDVGHAQFAAFGERLDELAAKPKRRAA